MIKGGRDIIRAGYAAGTKVAEIARQCDSTPGSVKVIAHRMGLQHRYFVAARVPPEKQADYRLFVWRKGCSPEYASQILGLEAGTP